ncbi:MAG TPA: ATP-binding protein [Longimicrobiales bacterium]|nr:ATP-binding protein [Longimicrobiales bacterium]
MATRLDDITTSIASTTDLDALLRHVPVGAVIAEAPSGRFVNVNASARQLWGGTMPIPNSVEEYADLFVGYRPDGRQYEADEWPIIRALQGEVVAEEEIEFLLDSGERRIMQVSAAPVRDESGDVVRAVALFFDVTEARLEERRREFLMQLSEELRMVDDPATIIQTAAVATGEYLGVTSASYADVDDEGKCALVQAEYRNGRVAPTGRYPLEEFGTALVERVRQGSAVAVEDVVSDPLAGADVFDDWSIRSLIAAPIVRRGQLVAVFTVMNSAPRRWLRSDVALVQQVADWTWQWAGTARAQSELKQSREWLSMALRAGAVAIWEWDLRAGEIHWSEEQESLVGLTGGRRSLTFSRWLALVHPDDRDSARSVARRIATMREGEVEFEHRLLRGEDTRWLTMRGRVIADARGLPLRVLGVAVDSTAQKQEALEREALLQQAREASEAKSHFIGVISHEFRTPLTAIIGYTDLLATGVSGAMTPAQERQLERIRASAWHLTQMVDEILTFSRLEAGHEDMSMETVDVLFVVREARALMAPAAAAKGLGLVCELPDRDQVCVRTDAGKLRQVLLNLLGNAVKFTEKGGVTLRVLPDPERVTFEVQDTGVGISEQNRARIFERFWQANREGTRAISGAGLGLTVSRHLVELMGGTISVESEPGAGSTFRFHLPLQQDADGATTGMAGLATGSLNS